MEVDIVGMKAGDASGLALLNLPYAWLGIKATTSGATITWYDQTHGASQSVPMPAKHIWLRVRCDFNTEKAAFSYSLDGHHFQSLGEELTMVFQLKTFQGVRFALFNFNPESSDGGYTDFSNFVVAEPRAKPFGSSIPLGKTITFTSLANGNPVRIINGLLRATPEMNSEHKGAAQFTVLDRGLGRVALRAVDGTGFVTVTGAGEAGDLKVIKTDLGEASTFQWTRMESGDIMLMSLITDRYLTVDPLANGLFAANARGAAPDRKNGASFTWTEAAP